MHAGTAYDGHPMPRGHWYVVPASLRDDQLLDVDGNIGTFPVDLLNGNGYFKMTGQLFVQPPGLRL